MLRYLAVKTLQSFDFDAILALNTNLVLPLAGCELVERRENVIALGLSGVGKTIQLAIVPASSCARLLRTARPAHKDLCPKC